MQDQHLRQGVRGETRCDGGEGGDQAGVHIQRCSQLKSGSFSIAAEQQTLPVRHLLEGHDRIPVQLLYLRTEESENFHQWSLVHARRSPSQDWRTHRELPKVPTRLGFIPTLSLSAGREQRHRDVEAITD